MKAANKRNGPRTERGSEGLRRVSASNFPTRSVSCKRCVLVGYHTRRGAQCGIGAASRGKQREFGREPPLNAAPGSRDRACFWACGVRVAQDRWLGVRALQRVTLAPVCARRKGELLESPWAAAIPLMFGSAALSSRFHVEHGRQRSLGAPPDAPLQPTCSLLHCRPACSRAPTT